MRRLSPSRCVFEGVLAECAGHALGRFAELRIPHRVLTPLVRAYVACLGVDMSQVIVPPGGFDSLGAFFARRLRPEARPVCGDPGSVVSPCDGMVVGTGRIEDGATAVLVIKDRRYRVPELVGDAMVAAGLTGGGYCVIYLHPRDYHRVHAPVDATLREVRHIPGARYPMAQWAAELARRGWGKNERVAFDLELPDEGRRCVLLMVAAFGVGGIECPQLPGEGRPRGEADRAAAAAPVTRGDEIGTFRLGSSVVLLWPAELIALADGFGVGARVLVGQRIGRVTGRAFDASRPALRPGT